MKLFLDFDLPEGEIFDIELNHETKEVNSTESEAVFELDKEGEYILKIEQRKEGFLFRPVASWILFVLTAIFRGVFYIATLSLPFSEGEYGEKWWADIRPYRLQARMVVTVNGDTSKKISITNTHFDFGEGVWTPPFLTSADGEEIEVTMIPNKEDFRYQYTRYLRATVSVTSVGLVVFGVGLVYGLKASNHAMIILYSCLLAVFVLICLMVLLIEHSRMKKMAKSAYQAT